MELKAETRYTMCDACNISLHQNNYESHFNGKKHIMRQEQYNKKYKSIFVSGISKFTPEDLKQIFNKYGEVASVSKQKNKSFAFIQFVNKESVEKALSERTFAGGLRLFTHRFDENKNKPNVNKNKSRKLSETLSNTSQPEGVPRPQSGVAEWLAELPDPDCCPPGEDVLWWQVNGFISQVELPADMYQALDEVKADVENTFVSQLPGCQVIVFGSCSTMLAFKNSDVDLFIQTSSGEQPEDFVRKEAKAMYKSRLFNVIARIPSARVPIVKFEHIKTGWQGDLTANSKLGVRNSHLIRFLVSLDPSIRPLVMVIKHWAKVCGVTGLHHGMTSYALVMFVIFYMQQLDPPLLPTVASLQQLSGQKQYCLGWDCSFCDEDWKVRSECLLQSNNLSLRELLTGFFQFYHNFEYNNVICPLLGRAIPVKDFESESTLPDEMSLYKEVIKSDPKCKLKTDVLMRTQDPFELSLNITRNVADRVYYIFREACKISVDLCHKEEDCSLLKSLFSIDQESLDLGINCLTLNIPFKNEPSDTCIPVNDLEKWYRLTVEAILLVMREILKLNVELNCLEMSPKVKKLESAQDVHTPINSHNSDGLTYVCCGKAGLWNSRKKMRKIINTINNFLSVFEKEICISNALYHPDDSNTFYFSLFISSLDQFIKSGKVIKVVINTKKCQSPLVKEIIQFIKFQFKFLVLQAADFISKVQCSLLVSEAKETKEIFNFKLSDLPNLEELLNRTTKLLKETSASLAGKEKVDSVLENFVVSKDDSGEEEKSKDECPSTGVCPNSSGTRGTETSGDQARSVEEKHTLGSDIENMTNSQVQTLIDRCVKSTSPNQVNSNRHLDDSATDQNTETRSTSTLGGVNPFLASIEKVALTSMGTEVDSQEGDVGNNIKDDKAVSQEGEYDVKMEKQVAENENTNINNTSSVPSSSRNDFEHGTAETVDDSELPCSGEKVMTEQRSNVKSSLQRPKSYLERPSKQIRPNNYKHNWNEQQSVNESQRYHSWPRLKRCPYPTNHPQQHSYRADDCSPSERPQRYPNNHSTERQKMWYPSLFRHNN